MPRIARFLLTAALVACGGSNPAPEAQATAPAEPTATDPTATEPAPAEPAATRTLEGGLGTLAVAAVDAPRFFGAHGHFEPDGFFTPTDAELEATLRALGPALAALPRAAGPADADRYYRHLVGVERAGRRQLFVFGFCDGSVRPGPRWTEPFSIDDGGDCYFEGFYDLDENAFRDLAFHGEA
ncbi:MAG TPA: hypothetical protein RMH85_20680 [Polyangiaceae bacterium LLY-WYZ-15_(1-7)]|nr:hypothetical protein [Sandaracinus sp.]HJL06203.1 hypothetical protein [Polyangiaceae bacterium LLY-WYZ-15_(1-7)]HJL10902.1 hypothetical protein [Polyangiaceae bacterium LLY-WYZ-15_(1-7)]HJL50854.1 hypothetical protein [Polyangiaceae bacterium LLY-WYZ-15_(1-7)]